jgi:hypothetical protein
MFVTGNNSAFSCSFDTYTAYKKVVLVEASSISMSGDKGDDQNVNNGGLAAGCAVETVTVMYLSSAICVKFLLSDGVRGSSLCHSRPTQSLAGLTDAQVSYNNGYHADIYIYIIQRALLLGSKGVKLSMDHGLWFVGQLPSPLEAIL